MRPSSGQVCQSLIVVSYWRPGSAHAQAAYPIWSQSSRERSVLEDFGSLPSSRAILSSVRQKRFQLPSFSTDIKKACGTRTELLEFWPDTVEYASPLKSMSYPAAAIAATFFSSLTFQLMNCSISG